MDKDLQKPSMPIQTATSSGPGPDAPRPTPFEADPFTDTLPLAVAPVIGIDLGTRFSCVSVWRNSRTEIIPDAFGNRTIPSVCAFYRSAKLVGHNALAMKDVNPLNTIYDVKRIIGRRLTDPSIEHMRKLLSYELVDDQTKYQNILVQLDRSDCSITRKSTYRPEEICSFILAEIRRMASKYLACDITQAVITVPAYFNDAQRQATIDAAQIAGLEVLKIINEPTAAVLAYGLGSKRWAKEGGGNVIVYDLGAGTLDVSLTNISNGSFQTLAVGGNTHTGGEDFDYLLMNYVMLEFQKQHRITTLSISKLSQIKLKNAIEIAKKLLSTTKRATVCVDNFHDGHKLYCVLTREQLEGICNELFIMCMKPIHDVLASANLTKQDIDEVIMVGGSTRIPKIRKLILDYFKDTTIRELTCSLNPDEVVSAGASIYGYIMTHQADPFSKNLVLLDVTPLSLGIETLRKQMTCIIPRNTTIPASKTKVFSTDSDDQDTVSIKIFEGERKLTKHNFHVGTFDLTGFAKGPRGYPTIKITFAIDLNGILQVTACEKRSDVKNSINITSTWGAKGRLSQADITKLIADAEMYEQIDTMYALKVGFVHEISSFCSTIMLNLKDTAFNLTKADRHKIRLDVKENMSWLARCELVDFDIAELQERSKRLHKLYAPLIVRINKENDQFKEVQAGDNTAATVEGDDDDADLGTFEQAHIAHDPSEYDKEEIKALKKTISDLGRNILSVVNNPVSRFEQADIDLVSDYIGSVTIWLYTTTASTSMEFVAKIDEINKYTEDIMRKYETASVFHADTKFTVRDELQLTCLTLNTSIKSNFFSLKSDDVDRLTSTINETMFWLLGHQKEEQQVYQAKLDTISEMCNTIYNSMYSIKALEHMEVDLSDDDEEEDDVPEPPPASNRICEDIDSILDSMPDRPVGRKAQTQTQAQTQAQSKTAPLVRAPSHTQSRAAPSRAPVQPDVLVKIDMNRLPCSTLKYRRAECRH